MKVLVTGGTGFIGTALCRYLHDRGDRVVVLSRDEKAARRHLGNDLEVLSWDPAAGSMPAGALDGVEVVINLAGESIGEGRWTEVRKQRILNSRIRTTRVLVEAMGKVQERPRVLVSASAVGYYGPRGDEVLTEADPPGSDFLAKVCRAWEEEALKAEDLGLRVVLLRLGIVFGPGGGALARMVLPFHFFAGGPIGSGQQWVSWVHRDDVIEIIRLASADSSVSGPVNATAPQPVRMEELAKVIGKVLKRPSWLRVPGFALRLAFGEMADMLLTGQRVLPVKLQEKGYRFKYLVVEEALKASLFG
ncbi:NAD-dependent epimerase/dehydratase family protein [Calderihabitans maritimus]|uniref:NAD-dependent epimerase/dehydratase family protein n=1 Tax=Calderihabitans maritimus TaxID=1246530 RepID=A0A1Z5HW08_9FIRM|nr:TIGR01777 family oxidoreductase [Calderihabitans maritimus]GAW93505.1 NAD-dependent epimerase/dehydratase family protein [Calderihabitans maritimus]